MRVCVCVCVAVRSIAWSSNPVAASDEKVSALKRFRVFCWWAYGWIWGSAYTRAHIFPSRVSDSRAWEVPAVAWLTTKIFLPPAWNMIFSLVQFCSARWSVDHRSFARRNFVQLAEVWTTGPLHTRQYRSVNRCIIIFRSVAKTAQHSEVFRFQICVICLTALWCCWT